MGIFNRLYELLEEACHSLDLQVAHDSSSNDSESGESFARYSAALAKLSAKERELQSRKQHAEAVEQIITYLALVLPNPESNQQLVSVRQEVVEGRQQIEALVSTCKCYKHQYSFFYR